MVVGGMGEKGEVVGLGEGYEVYLVEDDLVGDLEENEKGEGV